MPGYREHGPGLLALPVWYGGAGLFAVWALSGPLGALITALGAALSGGVSGLRLAVPALGGVILVAWLAFFSVTSHYPVLFGIGGGSDPPLFSRLVLPVGEEPRHLAGTYQSFSGSPHSRLCVPLQRGLGFVWPAGCSHVRFAAGHCTTIAIRVRCAEHGRDGLGVFGGGLGLFRACGAEAVSIPSVTCLTEVRLCIWLVAARSNQSACPVGNFANVMPPGLRATRKLACSESI